MCQYGSILSSVSPSVAPALPPALASRPHDLRILTGMPGPVAITLAENVPEVLE